MKDKGRSIETGWLPLRDSYEEAVLTWYEQIENSFRRRESASGGRRAARPGEALPVKVETEVARRVYD